MPPALEVDDLTKDFGTVAALRGVDLSVEAGTVHGLVGPNGAGKTTVLRAVLGLVEPDAGSVRVFGREVGTGPPARRGVGGFVDTPRFPPRLSAHRALSLLAGLDEPASGAPGMGSVDDALEAVGLIGRARTRVGTFSVGLRQRLGLAATLLRGARLLVLDEPTSGLDAAAAMSAHELLRDLAARHGVSVLISSHDLGALEALCDDVTVMAAGAVVHHGSVADLVAMAPAASHLLRTSDDVDATRVAASLGLAPIAGPSGGLVVSAGTLALDELVLVLASAGVAVRGLAPLARPLEVLMQQLVGDGDGDGDRSAGAGEPGASSTPAAS